MITVRPAAERGQVNLGWLASRHTFSFGQYHDPEHMGVGHLRVINEDRVQPGAGFQTHGHQNMEIISYVIEGTLAHQDSTGNSGVITPGEVQVMSAGSGIRHSELNGSTTEPVHFLQIWVVPAITGTAPGYCQQRFDPTEGLTLLVSPDARDGSLAIGQDADLHRVLLPTGGRAGLNLRNARAWVQVVKGSLAVGETVLAAGDGAAITGLATLDLRAQTRTEALLFDLQ